MHYIFREFVAISLKSQDKNSASYRIHKLAQIFVVFLLKKSSMSFQEKLGKQWKKLLLHSCCALFRRGNGSDYCIRDRVPFVSIIPISIHVKNDLRKEENIRFAKNTKYPLWMQTMMQTTGLRAGNGIEPERTYVARCV